MLLQLTPRKLLIVLTIWLSTGTAAPAQEARDADALQAALLALQADVAQLKAQGAATERLAELERRIDLLAAEVEARRTGGAASPAAERAPSVPGFAPGASKVYHVAQGVSLGGYGEALYQNFAAERQDGRPANRTDQLDFVRAVVYVGYKFSDRILFNSEVEFEHATTGEGAEEKGEVSLEFGYLEFKPWKDVGLRAGLLLMPVGFVNELHEAPVFHGARRPQVEQSIIPSTWRENGAGVFGATGAFEWRAYAVAGLDSAGFEGSGLREGRQGGSQSKASDLAFTGRLDFTGAPGLLLGGSVFTGDSGQGATVDGRELGARVTLLEGHLQYEQRGFQLRALFARTRVGDAARVNAANGLVGDESVGARQYGWYVQAAYDLLTLAPRGQWSLTPFVRYEKLDTQQRVPAGFARDPANARRLLTVGVGVKPLPNVVMKADFQRVNNGARSGVNQFNLALGYLF